jgi:NADPH-dependent 2,4-dienoyl-CoA reductase/sulfur reductase-like enzyme
MIRKDKIIIIGGNAAGPAAAAKAKRVNPDAEVILFEAGDFISTGTCELPYLFSGEINNHEDIVFFNPDTFYEKKGVKVYINHFVEDINTRNKTVKVRNLKTGLFNEYPYDKLVLTSGSSARKHIQLKDAVNSFTIKNVSDVLKIKEYLNSGKVKNISVIGSGFIGLEASEVFSKAGYSISLIEKAPFPFPAAEPEIRVLIKELLAKNNIDFYPGADIIPVLNGSNIKALNINGRFTDTDLVINALGFTPDVYLAVKSKLKLGNTGAVKVDSKLRTSDFNIYAAGDIAEVTDFITGKPAYLPFASYAYENGHIAGENAAGGNASTSPIVRNVAVRIFDKFYVSVGLTSFEAEENKFLINTVTDIQPGFASVMPGAGMVFGKVVFEKNSGRLLGASFLGGREVEGFGNVISALIKLKQPASILAELNYNYTPPLSPLKNLLSSLGRKIIFNKKY